MLKSSTKSSQSVLKNGMELADWGDCRRCRTVCPELWPAAQWTPLWQTTDSTHSRWQSSSHVEGHSRWATNSVGCTQGDPSSRKYLWQISSRNQTGILSWDTKRGWEPDWNVQLARFQVRHWAPSTAGSLCPKPGLFTEHASNPYLEPSIGSRGSWNLTADTGFEQQPWLWERAATTEWDVSCKMTASSVAPLRLLIRTWI